jgi:hypothetical protein
VGTIHSLISTCALPVMGDGAGFGFSGKFFAS